MIRFCARYHGERDKDTLQEATHFLAWKLASEWHLLIQKAKRGIIGVNDEGIEAEGFHRPGRGRC